MDAPSSTNRSSTRNRWTDRVVGAVIALVLATPATAFAAAKYTDLGDGATLTDSVTGDKVTLTVADGKVVVAKPTATSTPTATPTTATPTATPTAGAPTISYSGTWKRNGTDNYTTFAGAKVTITFSGTGVTLTGWRDAHHTDSPVTIDGRNAGKTTSKAAVRSEGAIFTVGGLINGAHTLVVTTAGTVSVTGARVGGTGSAPATPTEPAATQSPTTTAPTATPTPTATTTTAPAGGIAKLTVSGNEIQANGRDTWFLGYNSFTMGGGCGSAAEVAAANAQAKPFIDSMRRDGHGVLRLFYWSGYSASTKAALQDLVNYAGARNVYTILTLSDGQKGCGNAGPSTLTANGYAHVREAATRFKDNHAVAFFEVANEPTSSDWAAGYLDKVKGTVSTIKGVDPDRLVGSGNQASYFLGGTDRQAAVNREVDVTSMHDYEGGCDASRTKQELSLSQGKPMIMGEFGTLDSGSFNSRSGTFACKIKTWAGYDGFAAAIGWSWQPGNGGNASEYGNLDSDVKTQQVLKTASLD